MAQNLSDQRHTVRFVHPDEVVFDKLTTLKAPVYLSGALVAPDAASSTITIYNNDNTVIVNAAAVTVSGSIAQYTVAAATFDEDEVDRRIRVEWSLTGDGLSTTVLRPENDGLIVRRELYPVISDGDLFRRVRALDPNDAASITSATTFQDERDDAWSMLINWLIQDEVRGGYIMSPSSLRETHILLSLSVIYGGVLASRLNPAYAEQAKDWEKKAKAAYNRIVTLIDKDGDALPDRPGRQGAAMGQVWLGGAPTSWGNF